MNLQFVVDGLLTGSMIGLGAIGVTLTYSILRFSNFAHGDFMAWGTYATLTVVSAIGAMFGKIAPIAPLSFGWPLIVAVVVGMAFTALLALLLDKVLFARLRAQGPGDHRRDGELRRLDGAAQPARIHLHLAADLFQPGDPDRHAGRLRHPHHARPDRAAAGDRRARARRASADDAHADRPLDAGASARMRRLPASSASTSPRSCASPGCIGGALACVAGVMIGILVQIRPLMGFDMLLPMFAAAILGGIGSVPGAVLGGLIIGLAEAGAVQLIGAEWRAAVSFIILMAVLFVRPIGLFGVRER